MLTFQNDKMSRSSVQNSRGLTACWFICAYYWSCHLGLICLFLSSHISQLSAIFTDFLAISGSPHWPPSIITRQDPLWSKRTLNLTARGYNMLKNVKQDMEILGEHRINAFSFDFICFIIWDPYAKLYEIHSNTQWK